MSKAVHGDPAVDRKAYELLDHIDDTFCEQDFMNNLGWDVLKYAAVVFARASIRVAKQIIVIDKKKEGGRKGRRRQLQAS